MPRLENIKIAVLMGGISSERDVSIRTGRAIENALKNQDLNVIGLDVDRQISARLQAEKVDVVFLALHGRYGEDGTIQGLLEIMDLPYTGSGVLASALAFHKGKAKSVLDFHNLPTPASILLDKGDFKNKIDSLVRAFEKPVVVKPCQEGSTIGISMVREASQLQDACVNAFRYDHEILIEEFIDGQEVTVGVLGDEPLPVIEVVPMSGFYDYEAKYTAGKTNYIVPARIDSQTYEQVQSLGLSAHQALGCQGASRVDIRLDKQGNPYILEVNTIPGMTETSLLPKAARAAGIEFGELVKRILVMAMEGKR